MGGRSWANSRVATVTVQPLCIRPTCLKRGASVFLFDRAELLEAGTTNPASTLQKARPVCIKLNLEEDVGTKMVEQLPDEPQGPCKQISHS